MCIMCFLVAINLTWFKPNCEDYHIKARLNYPTVAKGIYLKNNKNVTYCVVYGRFCRGCKLECNTETCVQGCHYIAVDWEPTALHLRYQTSQERVSQMLLEQKTRVIYIRKGREGSQMLLEQKTKVIYIRKGRGGESNAARAKDKRNLYQEGEGGVSQMLL